MLTPMCNERQLPTWEWVRIVIMIVTNLLPSVTQGEVIIEVGGGAVKSLFITRSLTSVT